MNQWPHAPAHHFRGANTFFITAGTHLRQHFYRSREGLDELQSILFAKAEQYSCWLQAWCLLSNHYHLVVREGDIRAMLARFHSEAALALNQRDGVKNRQVWFQYWDKALTFEGSWLARLRYTHENAVHHGVVSDAVKYPWCSAAWFERTARPAFVSTVRQIRIDRVKVYDDFESRAVADAAALR